MFVFNWTDFRLQMLMLYDYSLKMCGYGASDIYFQRRPNFIN